LRVRTNEKYSKLDFLAEPYSAMDPKALLSYFQGRSTIHHFPLSRGSRSHIKKADKVMENIYTFNNETYPLGENFDWKVNPSQDIEWLILLHKFYYAGDLGAAYEYSGDEKYARKWVELLHAWIEHVPDGFINSQVTGRRLQQWVLSYRYFISTTPSSSVKPDFFIQFLESLYSQTCYLSENLTPVGNHRTIELYAIFLVAVLFPELRDMERFLLFSKGEILKNMQEDLLSDGVQRELSPDYHHTVLKNYLKIWQIASLNKIQLPLECNHLIEKAFEFSVYVHKPDGFLPMISDGDSNSYLSLLKKGYQYFHDENLRYVFSQGKEGVAPPCRSKRFSKSGYCILRSAWEKQPYNEGFYLFFDCGPLGIGSHGHYDLLNFEMAAYGHTLIVDPGRYSYSEKSDDEINWRKVFKGTAYHNTVTVNGKDQIQYREGAPVGPEPKAILKEFTTAEGFDFLSGEAFSPEYPVVHERHLFFLLSEYWIILDRLKAEGVHDYALNFHLHPRAYEHTKVNEKGGVCITSPNLVIAQPSIDWIQTSIETGYISPEYGLKHEAPVISFSQKKRGNALYSTLLYPYRTRRPEIFITTIPVYHQGKLCAEDQAITLKIETNATGVSYSDYFFMAYEDDKKEYTFDDIRYKGALLLLRRDEQNQISNLQANRADFLVANEQLVLDFGGYLGTVSFQKRVLHLDTDAPTFQVGLDDVQEIVRDGISRWTSYV